MKKMIIPTTIFIVILALVISMAIIIPSKNIYEIQSSRIRDNIITSVQVQEKQATYPETVETLNRSIYTQKTDETSGNLHYKLLLNEWNNPVLTYVDIVSYGTTYRFHLVEDIISYKIKGNTKMSSSSDIYPHFNLWATSNFNEYSGSTDKIIEEKYTLQKNYVSTKAEFDALDFSGQAHTFIEGTYGGGGLGNLMVYAIDSTLSTAETIVIYFKTVFCVSFPSSTTYLSIPVDTSTDIIYSYNSLKLTPTYNYLSLENKTKLYGSDNKNISLSSNELMQNMTRQGLMPSSQGLSIPILADYLMGVETAIIKCSVQQYYDTDSVLCVSPYDSGVKSIFEVGDIVIPYRFGATGDTPISKYPNDDAKEYKVVGVNIIDDGAIWQKLTLQERRQILPENGMSVNTSGGTYFSDIRLYINSIRHYYKSTYGEAIICPQPRLGDNILIGISAKSFGLFKGKVDWVKKDGVVLVDGVDGYRVVGLGTSYAMLLFTYDTTKAGDYLASFSSDL